VHNTNPLPLAGLVVGAGKKKKSIFRGNPTGEKSLSHSALVGKGGIPAAWVDVCTYSRSAAFAGAREGGKKKGFLLASKKKKKGNRRYIYERRGLACAKKRVDLLRCREEKGDATPFCVEYATEKGR